MSYDLPEPPDRSRIEWEHNTDVYGAWRDARTSVDAGWRVDQSWCLYGDSVPKTWEEMCDEFGDSLNGAVILKPVMRLTDEWPSHLTAEGERALVEAQSLPVFQPSAGVR